MYFRNQDLPSVEAYGQLGSALEEDFVSQQKVTCAPGFKMADFEAITSKLTLELIKFTTQSTHYFYDNSRHNLIANLNKFFEEKMKPYIETLSEKHKNEEIHSAEDEHILRNFLNIAHEFYKSYIHGHIKEEFPTINTVSWSEWYYKAEDVLLDIAGYRAEDRHRRLCVDYILRQIEKVSSYSNDFYLFHRLLYERGTTSHVQVFFRRSLVDLCSAS